MSKTFDRFSGILFLAIGALFIVESIRLSQSAYGSDIGPDIFPMYLGIALVLLSIRLVYETFRYQQDQSEKEKLDYKRFAIILGAAILYAGLIETLGYVITTFVFLTVGFQTMQKGKLWLSILIAGVFSIGVYYVFVNVLQGTLPPFPFENMFF
ncbi:tripartite tricarboxylate transporter TctB family protein [Domibacillus enclensis]|uniref:Putative tricarboxylic transport membrane protein n=1 Tax=Domibacillus enclensis TaxID=1017273 RepID=A0A1N6V2Y3_9BACI|nr:tripartite tricarboxylate transporter TctB family protein [Domibacillus enclensis]OXS78684.1 transporter [Domibacillus enclensis]SIQ72129.1 putative tricarboxylic transport membrane protein [Domibacillus enclensis]